MKHKTAEQTHRKLKPLHRPITHTQDRTGEKVPLTSNMHPATTNMHPAITNMPPANTSMPQEEETESLVCDDEQGE